MGRLTKLNPETSAAIIEALMIGATYADAAGAAGVAYSTLRNWIIRGETVKSGKFLEFLEACRRAEAAARVKFTRIIFMAADGGDWRAAMEFLKRRDRATWGDSVDLTTDGAPITVLPFDLSRLSILELENLEELSEKIYGNSTGANAASNSG